MVGRAVTFWSLVLQSICILLTRSPPFATGEADSGNMNETFTHFEDNTFIYTTFPVNENVSWDRGESNGYVSDQYLTTTSFSDSTPYDPCRNVEQLRRVGDEEGLIELREKQSDCNEMWTWDLQTISPIDGIVLQFNEVYLRGSCVLQVFTLARGLERVQQRKFTNKDTDRMYFNSLLLQEQTVLVVLNAPYSRYKRFVSTLSFVNISYFAHPIDKMPPTTFNLFVPTTSLLIYDCSSNFTIPKALRCNMVKECFDNEDEEDCEYTKQGCEEGWVPYRDQCLRMEFVTIYSYSIGHPHPTFPNVAEAGCASEYQASLAKLPDAEGIALVGRMLRQSGLRRVAVGLKKLKPVSTRQRHLYRFLWQWGDKGSPIAYEQMQLQRDGPLLDCATLDAYPRIHFTPLRCVIPDFKPEGYVCMKPNPSMPHSNVSRQFNVQFSPPTRSLDQIPTKQCADGSLVQTFHQCPSDGQWTSSNFTLFGCRYGPAAHYALVCDGNEDCPDGSDEEDCNVPSDTPVLETVFICDSSQMIDISKRCDGMFDCFDESDELDCTTCYSKTKPMVMCSGAGCVPHIYVIYIDSCPTVPFIYEQALPLYIPSLVSLNGFGMSRMELPLNMGEVFHCFSEDSIPFSGDPFPFSGILIPSFLLNNGETDCPYGEDENISPENITCPGFYVCQYSGQCVHPDFVCDGINHCPYKDDERYCNLRCPEECFCEGYAYKCTGLSEPSMLWHARYLDLSGSGNVSSHSVEDLKRLKFLNLSRSDLSVVYLKNMPQIKILDLSFNKLDSLSSMIFEGLTGLRTLNLSGNPFISVLDSSFSSFIKASGLSSLSHLIISNTNLQSIEDRALSTLDKLMTLDIHRNQILFYDRGIFSGLTNLKTLLTDDSNLCCDYFQTDLTECIAPIDELSTCDDLLRDNVFRVFLWSFSSLAIVGNAGVLFYRVFSKQHALPASFRVFVCNLCTADLIMGIYMMIIGIADANFRGMYVAKEKEWKSSSACKIAGFLGLVSNEMSAMTICLITLDRLLVLAFPFKSQIYCKGYSAMVGCGIIWLLGLLIAVAPFVIDLDFYGETSICLPLPITRKEFTGQFYAFGVFIVLNLALFTFIGIGQTVIFCTIHSTGKMAGSHRREQEMAIARRLFLVVFTDFCCWFPVGLMGMLAFYDVPIPGEVNVWTAIFILPINSALNPFMYTFNTLLEKRRTAHLQQKAKRVLRNMQAELPKMDPSMAEEVVRVCIRSKVVKKEQMLRWLNHRNDSNISHIDSDASSGRTSAFSLRDTNGSVKSSTISE